MQNKILNYLKKNFRKIFMTTLICLLICGVIANGFTFNTIVFILFSPLMLALANKTMKEIEEAQSKKEIVKNNIEENILGKEESIVKEYEKELTKDIKDEEKLNNYKKELISILTHIKTEKEELMKIREILTNKDNLINITNVYVFENEGFKYIVDLKETKLGTLNNAVKTEFYDVFSKNKLHLELGKYIEQIKNYGINEYSGKVTKIEIVEPALLAYPNKLVPSYVLQQIYYQINSIDLNAPVLKKIKK